MTVYDSGWNAAFARFVKENLHVTVGIHGEDAPRNDDAPVSNAEIGYFQEYVILGGARSFMRTTFDENEQKWRRDIAKYFAAAALGRISVGSIADLMGMRAVSAVKNKIRSNLPPPLADATLAARERRGVSRTDTLIDTAQLINAVDYKK